MRQSIIDLTALQSNFDCLHRLAPDCSILSMIKADAYGHGLVAVARALPRSNAFGVATLSEATRLREAGITQRIVVMSGFFNLAELKAMQTHQLEAVIHQVEQIQLMEQHTITLPVWLKVNSGMNRLGFKPDEAVCLYNRLLACCPKPHLPLPVIVHFPSIDDNQHQWLTDSQYTAFNALINRINGPVQRSLMQSAGVLNHSNQHYGEWIRPGISLYGVSPLPGYTGLDHGLRPVMTLRSHLIAIQHISRGDYVGYGSTWQSPCNKRIGVVGIGYGDGYPRSAPTGTPVLIDGIECPLVGRVSMDMLTVDLTRCPQARLGSEAILWGRGLPIEHIASAAGTIPYELLCRIGITSRVEQVVR